MLPPDALATSYPSLVARARELFGVDGGEDALGDAYERLCRADVQGRLRDRSAQGIKRWMRSALLNIRNTKPGLPAPDALELQLAGIL